MKKIKDPVNILLLLAVFFLSIFIIVPPILRLTIPDVKLQEDKKSTEEKDDITILSCSKTDPTTSLTITSRSKYVNDTIEQNIIIYEQVGIKDNNSEVQPLPEEATKEITLLSEIDGISINKNTNKTIISISKYIVDNNNANTYLTNQFKEKPEQRKYYEEQGFTCNETKN